jgi:pimeloyl-ACP methyl ester carboxylesterase
MRIRSAVTVLASGLALHYGERGGVPLILLHGYSDSWRSCVPLLDALPRSIRAVAPSQRGHGDTGKPVGRYDAGALARDVADLMDRLGIMRAVIAGHSMGSVVAHRFASEHPERTLGLVLIGGFATLKGHPDFAVLWNDTVAALADPVDPGFVRSFQLSTIAKPVPAEFLDMVVAESRKVPAHVWRAALRALLDDDPGDALARIAATTLLLWGERDTCCSRHSQEALVAAIPKVRLITYADVGHALHWEEPQRAAADIAAFVATAVATTA